MKTHQIPIEAFTTALKLMGETEVDNDETSCIIANLIYESKVKVKPKTFKVVMNPFPNTSELLEPI